MLCISWDLILVTFYILPFTDRPFDSLKFIASPTPYVKAR